MPAITIAIAGIALGIAAMLISVAIEYRICTIKAPEHKVPGLL